MFRKMIARKNEDGLEQSVEEHLISVAEKASAKGKNIGLENLMLLTGLLHDIGKGCENFQEYLINAIADPSSVRKGEVDHSTAGGKYIFEEFYKNNKFQKLTAQIISTAIISHHGMIDILDIEGDDNFTRRMNKSIEISFNEVLENTSETLFKKYDIAELFLKSSNEIECIFAKITKITDEMNDTNSKFFLFGCLERIILSILIDADRTDAAEFMNEKCFTKEMNESELFEFWTELQISLNVKIDSFDHNEKLYTIRNMISEECFEFSKYPAGIYCLPIPTGGGKTLGGLNFAIEHSKKHKKKRIIYVSPFLSILEQNADEYREALGDSEFILEHHSNIIIDDDKENDINYKYSIETWQQPIILTTMVQFLNVLFKDRIQNVRRMNSLINSVIIIDEIQSLPIKCVSLFNCMMNFLSQVCDVTIILCSATQPLLGQVDKQILYGNPKNMSHNIESQFKDFKRTKIIPSIVKGGYNRYEMAEFVMDKMKDSDNVLVILNTKSAVRNLYLELESIVNSSKGDIEIVQLTTYMCAEHRSDTIKELKQKLKVNNKRLICISTQLIEAGVNISFKCVVRSLSGLDSIAQAAGRCNRNGEREVGYVYIVNYNDKEENISRLEDIKYAQDATRQILDKYADMPEYYENDLLSTKAMNSYYERYFFDRKSDMDYVIKQKNTTLYDLLSINSNGTGAFQEMTGKIPSIIMKQSLKFAGQNFEVIGNDTVGLLVPYKDGRKSIEIIEKSYDTNEIIRELRKMQRYTINLYRDDSIIKKLEKRNAIDSSILDGHVLILREGFYDEKYGVSTELEDLIS